MNKVKRLLIVAVIALASTFFIAYGGEGEVEAKTCPIGQFPWVSDYNGGDVVVKCKFPVTEDNSNEKINNIKQYVLYFLKMIIVTTTAFATLRIVMAGYNYIFSRGNSDQIEEAKTKIMQAGIGILVASSAFIILNIVTTSSGFIL
ncbi:hypothetical protein IMZ31_20925 (plasmid) [Pontibacillus sp. ALD_SL1]|uniref:hypothetical protein n=1 Tax=Pontibacillus sp. ALD_SL1 TaxID=2777185 RepID=UPI001A96DC88|nr:hypothetical protein [Pontibacillus sp. ALD_SL1]QST03013.1 hypothetical protein IMZ31_20925 [Pontibacillus sp. ALD_SL1]